MIINGSEVASPFELISWNGVISCTRNMCMSSEIFRNDFNISDGYIVRISLDGDKISNKFKIKPITGYMNNDTDIFNHQKNFLRVDRNSGEQEEVILSKKINILPYIKQIDIFNNDSKSEELYKSVKDSLESKQIPVNLVRKFKIVENVDLDEYLEIIL